MSFLRQVKGSDERFGSVEGVICLLVHSIIWQSLIWHAVTLSHQANQMGDDKERGHGTLHEPRENSRCIVSVAAGELVTGDPVSLALETLLACAVLMAVDGSTRLNVDERIGLVAKAS